MNEEDKRRYHVKGLLKELSTKKGRATEMVSLYIPPTKQVSDVTNYLTNEQSQCMNIKSKQTRKNVSAAIESAISRLKSYGKISDTGLVLFIGQADDKFHGIVIEPPFPVPTFKYVCDSNFYLDPLREMVEERDRYGIVVIDRSEATFGLLTGLSMEVKARMNSLIPSKHRQGGQSAQRFERDIAERTKQFYVRVAELMTDLFLDADIRGLMIGGPGMTKDDFYDGKYIHHELKKKVIGVYGTGYSDEQGLKEVVEIAKDVLKDNKSMIAKKKMEQFMKEVMKNGKAAYGKDNILTALERGAVDTIILSEEEATGENLDFYEEKCDATRSELVILPSGSEEGIILTNVYGGMVALLRYSTM